MKKPDWVLFGWVTGYVVGVAEEIHSKFIRALIVLPVLAVYLIAVRIAGKDKT